MNTIRGKKFHRRTMLSGLGAAVAAVALPGLRTTDLFAEEGSDLKKYKRLLIMHSSNGTLPGEFWVDVPRGGVAGADVPFKRILKPLEEYRERMMTLANMHMTVTIATKGFGGGHEKGMGCLLTGMPLLEKLVDDGTGGNGGFASGISIDQHIANTICNDTKFKTLDFHLGANPASKLNVRRRMSYTGSDQPISPMDNPFEAFKRLFGDFIVGDNPVDDAALKKALAERRSLLDTTARGLSTLSKRLPVEDRPRIDQHLESIRQIELRLNVGGSGTPEILGCEAPTMPDEFKMTHLNRGQYREVMKLYMDMLTMGLACDLSRVGTLVTGGGSTSINTFPWLGDSTNPLGRGHHGYSHTDSEPESYEALTRINAWYAEQFLYMVKRMDSIKEGNGTMLDNTVMVWFKSMKSGGHGRQNIPNVIIGGESNRGGPGLKQGQHRSLYDDRYPYDGTPHSSLLLSLAHTVGLKEMTKFGHADWENVGPVKGITHEG